MSKEPEGMPVEVREWIEGLVHERGPVPKPEAIFRHALGYHECALRCLELRDGQGFLFQPSLVLLAFVVEIYLKGLLALEGKDTREGRHDLDKIYCSLAGETQAKIAERYRQRRERLVSFQEWIEEGQTSDGGSDGTDGALFAPVAQVLAGLRSLQRPTAKE